MSLQGRRKIPVPSFAPPPTSNDTKKTAAKAKAETNNDDDVAKTQNDEIIIPESRQLVRLPVNTQCMIHLDNALQLYCHQQKQQGLPDSDRVSFANFSKISSKVETIGSADDDDDLAAASADLGESQDTKLRKNPLEEDLPELWNLSKEERFWHDLYCVAVPALYLVNDSAVNSNVEKNETNNNSSPQRKKKRRRRLAAVALELTLKLETGAEGSKNNRVKELRRLVREASTHGVPKAKSEKALCLLLALRQENEKELDRKSIIAANATSSSNNNSDNKTNEFSTADSLLRDSGPSSAATENDSSIAATATTIDDRIRAKAKERERNLEQARAARKDPREERVAIADALYSYACHVLRRRQSRSQNKSRRFSGRSSSSVNANATAKVPSRTTTTASASTKCILTFKEVVESGLPNRSRKEIARIMLDIVEVLSSVSMSTSSIAPKFLKWKDFKTGEAYGVPISKNATVTIDTTDFKKVREILNRERFSTNAATIGGNTIE